MENEMAEIEKNDYIFKAPMKKEDWQSSYEKWCDRKSGILARIKRKDDFSWREILEEVVASCGYCNEFYSKPLGDCAANCPLFEKQLCTTEKNSNFIFWKLVSRLRLLVIESNEIDWQKAEKYAQQIADFIEEHGRHLGYLKDEASKNLVRRENNES